MLCFIGPEVQWKTLMASQIMLLHNLSGCEDGMDSIQWAAITIVDISYKLSMFWLSHWSNFFCRVFSISLYLLTELTDLRLKWWAQLEIIYHLSGCEFVCILYRLWSFRTSNVLGFIIEFWTRTNTYRNVQSNAHVILFTLKNYARNDQINNAESIYSESEFDAERC